MLERIDVSAPSTSLVMIRFHQEHRKRYVLARAFLDDMPGEQVVLDAACGCGYGYEYLTGLGHYIGLDYDPWTIDDCRDRYQLGDFRLGDLENPGTLFRLMPTSIVSLETAEHLRDPDRFLALVYQALPLDGRFVFSAPTSLTRDFDRFHLRDWDEPQWLATLRRAGFRVHSSTPMPFEAKFTDFLKTTRTTLLEKLSVLWFNLRNRRYSRDRWHNWILRNRFYWCSHLFCCTKAT
jgi:SAM-dependent methyltransferase